MTWFWNWLKSLFKHTAPAVQPVPIVPVPPPPPVPQPRSAVKPNIPVYAVADPQKGIDVSHYQPGIIWDEMVKSGQSFAFIKASEGAGFTDPEFAINWKSRQKLPMSPYHFFRASVDGAVQAGHFLKVIGSLGGGDLQPMLDWEALDGQTPAINIKAGQDWLDGVERATGRVPIIYTNLDTWNKLGNPVQFFRYPLFIANPGTICPKVPPPWSNWVFWQHSWTDPVPGVPSAGDTDLFNGTAQQLQDFIRTGKLPF